MKKSAQNFSISRLTISAILSIIILVILTIVLADGVQMDVVDAVIWSAVFSAIFGCLCIRLGWTVARAVFGGLLEAI